MRCSFPSMFGFQVAHLSAQDVRDEARFEMKRGTGSPEDQLFPNLKLALVGVRRKRILGRYDMHSFPFTPMVRPVLPLHRLQEHEIFSGPGHWQPLVGQVHIYQQAPGEGGSSCQKQSVTVGKGR